MLPKSARPRIRPAAPDDLPSIAAIYAHAVTHGTASFETVPPDEAEMGRRMERLLQGGHPWLVAEDDGGILGYAYAGPYHPRIGYRWTVETSIYVAPDAQRRGVGAALLEALVGICTERGFRQMVAVIGDEANAGSIAVHGRLGFRHVGTLRAVGRKHGRWLGSVIMQRPIGDGDETPPEGDTPGPPATMHPGPAGGSGPVSIRPATPADLRAITAIYAEAVANGTASFELAPVDEAEMGRRMEAVLAGGFPYFAAERGGVVVGYAYAGLYRVRPSYRFTSEDSVYVAPAAQGAGVGTALLEALLNAVTALGYRQMVALIGDSGNAGSIALHRRFGFRHVGDVRSVGRKHGRWLDVVLMQLALGDGDGTPPPFEPR